MLKLAVSEVFWKRTALLREAFFEVKSVQNEWSRRHFGRSDAILRGGWWWIVHPLRNGENVRFLWHFQK